MKIKSLGANQTVMTLADGTEIFFSYETPVAAYLAGRGYVVTGTQYSTTTSRHVNKWAGKGCDVVPQTFLNDLVKGA